VYFYLKLTVLIVCDFLAAGASAKAVTSSESVVKGFDFTKLNKEFHELSTDFEELRVPHLLLALLFCSWMLFVASNSQISLEPSLEQS